MRNLTVQIDRLHALRHGAIKPVNLFHHIVRAIVVLAGFVQGNTATPQQIDTLASVKTDMPTLPLQSLAMAMAMTHSQAAAAAPQRGL